MASSNIKLFDENKGNMLNDTEFNISTQRLNGLQTGVASSQLQNKAMYQASLVAYAIAQIMLQNGLNANDTDAVSAFVANLSSTLLQKVHDIATTEEAQTGVATGKWMSPALVKAAIDVLAAKAQDILSDATKTLYGLSSSAVPDDVFRALSAKAVINVHVNAGTTVTATKGDRVVTAISGVDGVATLYPTEFGGWTVSATVDGKAMTASINIKVVGVFDLTLSTNLEDASWNVVSSISEAGIASSIWSIGDTKTVKVSGIPYTAQIIGFAHDIKTAGGKAGITFQLVDCLDAVAQINVEQTVVGGWRGSVMRGFTLPNIFSQLDEDLQAVIKPVDKLSSVGSGLSTIETTSDKLFLLSEIEVFGYTTWSFAGEGTQYEWYKAGNSKIKNVRGSASPWWERSPRGQNSYFDFVDDKGTAQSGSPNSPLRGVSFAFCV